MYWLSTKQASEEVQLRRGHHSLQALPEPWHRGEEGQYGWLPPTLTHVLITWDIPEAK